MYSRTREYKKKVVPKYEEFLNGKWITLETIVSHYVIELLDSKLTESRNVFKLLAVEDINVEVSAGFDASGRHSKVKSFGDCSDHLILGGLRVISVTTQTNEMIYHEDSQGSNTEIPWFLIPRKEDHETVTKTVGRMEKEKKLC